MKHLVLFHCLIWGSGLSAFAGPGAHSAPSHSSPIGILPAFKHGVEVDPEERNPFGALAEAKAETISTGAEAAKITAILETLPVSGLSRSQSGEVRCVLLGDLRLEAGAVVPQLVEGQTDELFVQSISADEVVIVWRLEAGHTPAQARILRRKIDVEPKVEMILPGQLRSTDATQSALRKSVVVIRGKSGAVPSSIVPTSGLPPAKP